MSLLLAVIFGIAFGYILYRVGALDYRNIINALLLRDLSIPKFMILSVSITSVGIFSLRLIGLVKLDIITANPLGNILGGLIFGVGFALAGYCPGTSIGAMGEGKKDARYTVLGGMAGVLMYTIVQQYTGFSITAFDIGKLSLADLIHLNPFSVAIIYSISLALIVYLVDYLEQKKSSISLGGTMNYVKK
jgi:uncharacterized membrane protein YedE/YeeE